MTPGRDASRRGVDLMPEDTLLAGRARDFLAAGPADVVPLIASVCQLPGVPRTVAEHLARVLFADQGDFFSDASGRWALASADATAVAVAPPSERLCDLSYV